MLRVKQMLGICVTDAYIYLKWKLLCTKVDFYAHNVKFQKFENK